MIKRTFIKDVYETKFKEDPDNNFFNKIVITKLTHVFGAKLFEVNSIETLHPEYKDASDKAIAKEKIGFGFNKNK